MKMESWTYPLLSLQEMLAHVEWMERKTSKKERKDFVECLIVSHWNW